LLFQVITGMSKKEEDTETEKKEDYSLRVLDLFCGCGGMSLGLKQAGLHVVAGIDIWSVAIQSYQQNHSDHLGICGDLRSLPPEELESQYGIKKGEIDLLVGGPPCQSFSMAGKRDVSDPRNTLFMEYVRYLDYYLPRMFLMENVMGILSKKTEKGEKIIDIITGELSKNYTVGIYTLWASDFEVPQNRRRVFLIGIRKDLGQTLPVIPLPIPTIDQRIPVETILEPREVVDHVHYLSERARQGIVRKAERNRSKGAGFHAQILRMDRPSYTIPARYWKDGYDALVQYSETEIRRLTLLELKRIQTFPDDYLLLGSKKDQVIQIGNAVPCRLAYHLGRWVQTILQ
jgi:DNA (cytosine-5)-methyltransferase 1